MSHLQSILATFRGTSHSEREKGTYFEELICTYFRFEATYADLYSQVWLYSDWAKEIGGPQFGMSAKDTGIDLVAKTRGTGEYHAIQCKCYAEDYTVKKSDIDSFFTASGQKPLTLRYIVTTTDAKRLALEMAKRHNADHMSVVFSTYHSLDVISRAQHLHGLPPFDLVICDEAHRTTGASFEGDDESNFVKIHDNAFIRAAKRLYMTATPRIYGDMAKATAAQDNTVLYDMNNEAQFGKQLHVITFSEAVQLKLLTDYKVIVLTIDEAHVSARIQELLKDDSSQLKVDDARGMRNAPGKKGGKREKANTPCHVAPDQLISIRSTLLVA